MESHKPYEKTIFVCVNERENECCRAKGSELIRDELKAAVNARGLKGRVRVSKSLCLDLCSEGPVVMVFPENVVYTHVNQKDVPEIIKKHFP